MSQPSQNTLFYQLKRSRRARSIRLQVRHDGVVELICPWHISFSDAQKFYESKRDWVAQTLASQNTRDPRRCLPISDHDYRLRATDAHALATQHLQQLNQHYGYQWKQIEIGKWRSQWGCCRPNDTLAFHYHILSIPPPLQVYLCAHELCHLKARNHSKHFWSLVATTIPDYKERRKQLKEYALG